MNYQEEKEWGECDRCARESLTDLIEGERLCDACEFTYWENKEDEE